MACAFSTKVNQIIAAYNALCALCCAPPAGCLGLVPIQTTMCGNGLGLLKEIYTACQQGLGVGIPGCQAFVATTPAPADPASVTCITDAWLTVFLAWVAGIYCYAPATVCGPCTPPLHAQYDIVLAGLGADLIGANGAWVVDEWLAYPPTCEWIKATGAGYTLRLHFLAGSYWSVDINKSGWTTHLTWNLAPTGDPCAAPGPYGPYDPYDPLNPLTICDDIDFPGTCAASIGATCTVATIPPHMPAPVVYASMKGQLSFTDVVKAIDLLPLDSDRNRWLKAMSAQIQDQFKRADCTGCRKRHLMSKLVHYWENPE